MPELYTQCDVTFRERVNLRCRPPYPQAVTEAVLVFFLAEGRLHYKAPNASHGYLVDTELYSTITSIVPVQAAPKDIVAIYDNKGETADRYTVVLDKSWAANPGRNCMISMSGLPEHPQGVSQFGEGIDGPHLGKRIEWIGLPKNVREHVIRRLTIDEKEG